MMIITYSLVRTIELMDSMFNLLQLKPDWFMPAEASLKRVHIQRLIYGLLEVAPPENASTCNHNSEPSAFPEIKENDSGLEFISEMSPGKSLNSLHSQSVQGMEMGLLDNISGIADVGMRELFEQRQHYDHGASFRRPGCTMSPIRVSTCGLSK